MCNLLHMSVCVCVEKLSGLQFHRHCLAASFLFLIREKASATRVAVEGESEREGEEGGGCLHCKLTLSIEMEGMDESSKVGFHLIWKRWK